MPVAWTSATEVVVAEAGDPSWKMAVMSCGQSSDATLGLTEALVTCVERRRGARETSAACLAAISECVEDDVVALRAIWEVCEVGLLCGTETWRARLVAWLRQTCVDWESEADEYASLLTHFRSVDAAEGWGLEGEPEVRSPLWQLVFRLVLRGRTVEAWNVLATHSTADRLRAAWAPVASLLREMPQPSADSVYEESRQRWKRRAARVRAAASSGEASLASRVPAVRPLLALLDEGPDSDDDAWRDLLVDDWEGRLLASLLYDGGDARTVVARALEAAEPSTLDSKARHGVMRAAFTGQALACVKVLYELGPDVSACAAAFAMARLCEAAGTLSAPPPSTFSLADRLAVDLADRLDWRLAIRVLRTMDDARSATRAALARADEPSTDADAADLAEACLSHGEPDLAIAVVTRHGANLKRRGQARAAATWLARAELLDPNRQKPAPDGRLETIAAAFNDRLPRDKDASDLRQFAAGFRDVEAPSSDYFAGTEADFLARYLDLLDCVHDAARAAPKLHDLLLARPPPRRKFLNHLLRILADVLSKEARFSSLATFGLLHRLYEVDHVVEDDDPLDPALQADLRSRLASLLADAAIDENRDRHRAKPKTPPTPIIPPPFSRSAADLLADTRLDVL